MYRGETFLRARPLVRIGDSVKLGMGRDGRGWLLPVGGIEASLDELTQYLRDPKSDALTTEAKVRAARSHVATLQWTSRTIRPQVLSRIFDIGTFDEEASLRGDGVDFRGLFRWKNKAVGHDVRGRDPTDAARGVATVDMKLPSVEDKDYRTGDFRFRRHVMQYLAGASFATEFVEAFGVLFCTAVDHFVEERPLVYPVVGEDTAASTESPVTVADVECAWTTFVGAKEALPRLLSTTFLREEEDAPPTLSLSDRLLHKLDARGWWWLPMVTGAALAAARTLDEVGDGEERRAWLQAYLRPVIDATRDAPAWQKASLGALVGMAGLAKIVAVRARSRARREADAHGKRARELATRRYVPRAIHTLHRLAKLCAVCADYATEVGVPAATASADRLRLQRLVDAIKGLQQRATSEAERVARSAIDDPEARRAYRLMVTSMFCGKTVRFPGIDGPLLQIGTVLDVGDGGATLTVRDVLGQVVAEAPGGPASSLPPTDVVHTIAWDDLRSPERQRQEWLRRMRRAAAKIGVSALAATGAAAAMIYRASEDGRRVYVGNLDYRTDDATLHDIFSEYGEVQSCSQVIRCRACVRVCKFFSP